MRFERSIFIILINFIVLSTGTVQPVHGYNENGLPPISVFTVNDYNQHPQNWAVIQDSNGVMYFGNTSGILIYDGHFWDLIPVHNNSIVRSLALDKDGTIYVGAVGEIGYLTTDPFGQIRYVSLLDSLPAAHRQFADVWRTMITPDGIVFFSRTQTMIWKKRTFQVIPFPDSLPVVIACFVRDQMVLATRTKGLYRLQKGAYTPISDPTILKGTTILFMLPFGEDEILVGAREDGLFRMKLEEKVTSIQRFNYPVNTLLQSSLSYCGVQLSSGDYALGTMTNGLFIIDRQGQIKLHLSKREGFPDNSVWCLYEDREGGLWAGLNQGIARIDLSSAITVFNDHTGLSGTVEWVLRTPQQTYAASSTGIYYLEGSTFKPVRGVQGMGWCVVETKIGERTSVLAGTYSGLYEIRGSQATRISSGSNVFTIYQSSKNPALIFYGSIEGLSVLKYTNEGWTDLGIVSGLNTQIRSMGEDNKGILWLGSHFDGLFTLAYSGDFSMDSLSIRHYGLDSGLPVLKSIKILNMGEHIFFGTSRGFYEFDRQKQSFTRSTQTPFTQLDSSFGISRICRDKSGDIWLAKSESNDVGWLKQREPGTYIFLPNALPQLVKASKTEFFSENEHILWIGTTMGLIRLDKRLLIRPVPDFKTLLTKITTTDNMIVFSGHSSRPAVPNLYGPGQNNFVFLFSAATYHQTEQNRFQYLLEGYDSDWSDWTAETKKEYTNLSAGTFTFYVQSKNLYDDYSTLASFPFTIATPYYKTWYAYLLYLAVTGFGIFLLIEWRSAKLKKDRQRLEEIIQSRTKELDHYAKKLEASQAEISAVNLELEAFAYSVSHDLKAPLRSISGFSRVLQEDYWQKLEPEVRVFIEKIDYAAKRMSELIDDLLKLSRLTRLELTRQKVDLSPLVREIAANLEAAEPQRKMKLEITPGLQVHGDPVLIKVIMENLLQNAWKFTARKEMAEIRVGKISDPEKRNIIFVRDNGAGFDMKYADKLFVPFQRLHSSTEFSGSGIGLTTVQRLINRHGGKIWAEARVEQGATFYFYLPGSSL